MIKMIKYADVHEDEVKSYLKKGWVLCDEGSKKEATKGNGGDKVVIRRRRKTVD